ncbi:MAG TPA: biotin--[acetyl-CoA-carboxylase] ligase [Blastocatellia bacterium]|nr:biotin--[acetyl-CoA-carboxylase] ligase [Blastocatellia bacterium]
MLGATLLRFDSLTSTNDLARDLAAEGAEEGLAVVARSQTAGRGSKGRSWCSPPGEGLYLSLVLRPRLAASKSPILTLAAAVAVAETLRKEFKAAADIKWPNDVLLSERKVCGILVESASEGEGLKYAIVGIGVNLLQREFPPDISNRATSLSIETGLSVGPDEFLPGLFEQLERWYSLAVHSPALVLKRYEELSSFARDCRVSVTAAGGSEAQFEGTTRGLTDGGALIVAGDDGVDRIILSAEIDKIRRAS